MDGISIMQIVLLMALALVIIAGRRFLGPHARDSEQMLSQLRDELMERRPVFSAETTKHREAEFIRDRLPSRRSGLIILLAILVGVAAAMFSIAMSVAAETNPRSVAVLPFVNLSSDPEDAYFVAGIHEEILNRLAKVPGLIVVARSSVVRYANSDKPPEEIAKELNVASILEGSVRPAGGRVRITAQLVDGGTSRVLWSETYDRELTDIFGVQSDVANNVARAVDAAFAQESPAQ